MMETLQQFWTWVYLIGGATFVMLVAFVIPFGLRDLLRLLNELAAEDRPSDDDSAINRQEP